MRVLIIAFIAALAACASSAAPDDPRIDAGPSPFPVARGTAPPPPQESASHAAPPEGRAAGGIDFGQWRQADPAVYGPAFQAQIHARYGNQEVSHIRSDLEANGFVCQDERQLDCRIETTERSCAFGWYVVVERARNEPIAGFDVMCPGARQG
jgi:hypothetical protein